MLFILAFYPSGGPSSSLFTFIFPSTLLAESCHSCLLSLPLLYNASVLRRDALVFPLGLKAPWGTGPSLCVPLGSPAGAHFVTIE